MDLQTSGRQIAIYVRNSHVEDETEVSGYVTSGGFRL